jgi:hypothetical protein
MGADLARGRPGGIPLQRAGVAVSGGIQRGGPAAFIEFPPPGGRLRGAPGQRTSEEEQRCKDRHKSRIQQSFHDRFLKEPSKGNYKPNSHKKIMIARRDHDLSSNKVSPAPDWAVFRFFGAVLRGFLEERF